MKQCAEAIAQIPYFLIGKSSHYSHFKTKYTLSDDLLQHEYYMKDFFLQIHFPDIALSTKHMLPIQ